MQRVSRFLILGHIHTRNKSRQAKSAYDYCSNLVRCHDYENYLCTLLLKLDQREKVFAIRAFNIEVAKVVTNISTSALGNVRLQFWDETIEGVFKSKPRKHPVAEEMHRVLQKDTVSKRHLLKLVSSRSALLSANSFSTVEHMEQYAEDSTSPIYYVVLTNSGVADVKADHAASHLGKAQGLTNLIRSIPYHSQRKFVCLPQDQLSKNKVSHETVFRGGASKGLRDVVFEVASRAYNHLQKSRKLRKDIPKDLHTIWLTSVPPEMYLERLRLVDFDAFHPSLQLRDSNLAMKLLWKRWTGQF